MSDKEVKILDVDVIRAKEATNGSRDQAGRLEARAYRESADLAKHNRDMRAADLADKLKAVENRAKYTSRLFWLMVVWVVVVLALAAIAGIRQPTPPVNAGHEWSPSLGDWLVAYELSDTVLLALIGGLTANVFGLFLIVAKYLFPRP